MPKKIGNLRPLPRKMSVKIFTSPISYTCRRPVQNCLSSDGDEKGEVERGNSIFSSCDRYATQPRPRQPIKHYCSLPSEVGRFTLKKYTVVPLAFPFSTVQSLKVNWEKLYNFNFHFQTCSLFVYYLLIFRYIFTNFSHFFFYFPHIRYKGP